MATGKTAGLIKPCYATAYALVRYIASRPFAKTVSSSLDINSSQNFLQNLLEKVKDFFYS